MSIGNKNTGVEEVEYRWGGDSRVTQLLSKAAVGSLRRVLCEVVGARPMSSVWLCVLLYLDLEGILSFIVFPTSNRVNLGLSLFFTTKGHMKVCRCSGDWLKNYFFYFPWISPCAERMRRDAFFSFKKYLSPGNIWWVLSSPVDWNCHYFVCTMISLSVI